MDSDFEFPIVRSILSNIVLIVWLNWLVMLLYFMSLHFKYNFRQIKDSMKRSLRSRNLVLLMDVFHRYNHLSELTLQYNKLFKYVLAVIYFLFTPVVNILVYMTVSEVNYILRIFYALIAIVLSLTVLNTNYISSSLSSSAHDFTSDLYSFLFNTRISIAVQHRFKISSFIEKLCGPVIGYYCYDLFAFTNYEFYEFVSFVFCNYFLSNDLIFNV